MLRWRRLRWQRFEAVCDSSRAVRIRSAKGPEAVPPIGKGVVSGSARIEFVRSRWFLLGWVGILPIWAAPTFVGDRACAPCHPSQWQRQSATQHAKALLPINDSPLPALLMDRPLRERGGVAYEYEVVDEGLQVTVHKDGAAISAVLEWTFGGGVQGLTAVGRIDGKYFEHRVSYYPARGRPAITIGHPLGLPRRARDGLGLLQDERTITECFQCHATGVARSATGPHLANIQPGIRCERCHGPGAAHAQENQAGPDARQRTIRNPGNMSAQRITEMCGECHRLPDPGMLTRTPEKDDPFNVRFQPMGLLASRCFSSSQALSCITCHDPHEDARKDAAFYIAKCLECHPSSSEPDSDCRRQEEQNCLPCHMPRASPSPYLYFTDHRIRVE